MIEQRFESGSRSAMARRCIGLKRLSQSSRFATHQIKRPRVMKRKCVGIAAILILILSTLQAQDAQFAANNLKYSRDFYSKVHLSRSRARQPRSSTIAIRPEDRNGFSAMTAPTHVNTKSLGSIQMTRCAQVCLSIIPSETDMS